MASFGHLAVGMMAGRLHVDGATPLSRSRRLAAIVFFALLAMLPDADVFGVAMGLNDSGASGHRGASHSLLVAIAAGACVGLLAHRFGRSGLRTGIAVTIALASHGLLDALGREGRGIPLFWPLSEQRFHAPWRILPDAPRGMQFLSQRGLVGAAWEFVYFFPLTAYAFWPRRPFSAPLTLVSGTGAAQSADPQGVLGAPLATPAPSLAPPPGADGQGRDQAGEPALRSSG